MCMTDRDSAYQALTPSSNNEGTKFPPITGVMHVTLVLRDAAFSTMSYNDLKAVIDAKPHGSLILHEVFKDDSLNIFIITSSISYIVGNCGQANYVAGNAFMVGLAMKSFGYIAE